MMTQFVQKYTKEEEKQDLLLAVDTSRTVMRKRGRKSNQLNKKDLSSALKDLSGLYKS